MWGRGVAALLRVQQHRGLRRQLQVGGSLQAYGDVGRRALYKKRRVARGRYLHLVASLGRRAKRSW
jgi:hypothetical protein